MTSYNVIVTVESTATDDETTGRTIDALTGHSPAISWDDDGHVVVTVTIDTTSLASATAHLVDGVRRATGSKPTHVEAMTTEEFDRRTHAPAVPA